MVNFQKKGIVVRNRLFSKKEPNPLTHNISYLKIDYFSWKREKSLKNRDQEPDALHYKYDDYAPSTFSHLMLVSREPAVREQ